MKCFFNCIINLNSDFNFIDCLWKFCTWSLQQKLEEEPFSTTISMKTSGNQKSGKDNYFRSRILQKTFGKEYLGQNFVFLPPQQSKKIENIRQHIENIKHQNW